MKERDNTMGILDFGDPIDDRTDAPVQQTNPQPTESRNTFQAGQPSLDFGQPDKKKCIIKVVGVGGGGGNAVNHMYKEGIHDVDFAVCNTDSQALSDSPVPVHLQLGKEGLGAGDKPEKAREAAEDTAASIKNMLNDGTRMTFITAGMGGGTGTGAAPVVARISKELDILTVGIVTIPFLWEGPTKIDKALDGVEEMAKHVDALLVINNERLREIYSDLSVLNSFDKADDILSIAAKSIAEIITTRGRINLDFNDVRTVLKDGGVAIMSMGYGEGESRVQDAINDALNSPLLNDNDIFNSKKILLNIAFAAEDNDPSSGLMMEEMNYIHNFMAKFGTDFEIKWGMTIDQSLGSKVKITILATGFGISIVDGMENRLQARTQEQIDKEIQEEQQKKERDIRRGQYYGGGANTKPTKRRSNVYIFSFEDLDNDDVILAVDTTPTYKRTKTGNDEIRKIGKGDVSDQNKPEQTENIQGTISF